MLLASEVTPDGLLDALSRGLRVRHVSPTWSAPNDTGIEERMGSGVNQFEECSHAHLCRLPPKAEIPETRSTTFPSQSSRINQTEVTPGTNAQE